MHIVDAVMASSTSMNLPRPRSAVLYSGVGRWFHLRGLQEPLSLPRKKWPGPAYFPCAHMYVRTYNWASEALDYVWPATGEIETNFMRRGCFFITLASQEFYGGASPWSRCVSYATVSHRTSSLPRLLRGR